MIGIIIPVYNEEKSLPLLLKKLGAIIGYKDDIRVVFVDDGSTDNSKKILRRVCRLNKRFSLISFEDNQGKDRFFNVMMTFNQFQYLITFDSDLQVDVNDILRVAKLLKSYDLVIGWRRNRRDSFFTKILPSKLVNVIFRFVFKINVHDFNTPLKGFKYTPSLKNINYRGGSFRFFVYYLVKLFDYSYCEIIVAHYQRKMGKSKYGVRTLFTRTWQFLYWIVRLYFKYEV